MQLFAQFVFGSAPCAENSMKKLIIMMMIIFIVRPGN